MSMFDHLLAASSKPDLWGSLQFTHTHPPHLTPLLDMHIKDEFITMRKNVSCTVGKRFFMEELEIKLPGTGE